MVFTLKSQSLVDNLTFDYTRANYQRPIISYQRKKI